MTFLPLGVKTSLAEQMICPLPRCVFERKPAEHRSPRLLLSGTHRDYVHHRAPRGKYGFAKSKSRTPFYAGSSHLRSRTVCHEDVQSTTTQPCACLMHGHSVFLQRTVDTASIIGWAVCFLRLNGMS